METNRSEMLTEVFCSVIESLAFMFGDAAEDGELPASQGDCVLAAMTFSGPTSGRLELAVPEEMRPEIAANVLGVDPDDELVLTSADDALMELLNVTCGQLLTRMAGEEPVFDLSVPEVSALDAAAWAAMAQASDVAKIMIDESPILLRLTTDE